MAITAKGKAVANIFATVIRADGRVEIHGAEENRRIGFFEHPWPLWKKLWHRLRGQQLPVRGRIF